MTTHHSLPAKMAVIFLVLLSLLQLSAMFLEELYLPHYGFIITWVAVISLMLTWWLTLAEKKKNLESLYLFFQALLRYSLAFQIGTYGASKLMNIQFDFPEYVKDMPVGNLNGIQLTWFYYSHAMAMSSIVGSLQCIGGALLVFRRTTLAGALLLLPILINIVLINAFYDIHKGAFVNSLLYTGISFYLIYLNKDWIIAALNQYFQPLPGFLTNKSKNKSVIRWTFRSIALAGPWILMLLVETMNPVTKSPLDGVWKLNAQVIQQEEKPLPFDTVSIKRLYFSSSSFATWQKGERFFGSKLSVNPDKKQISMQLYATRDSIIGSYQLKDSLLTITGRRNGEDIQYIFVKEPRRK